MSSRRTLTRPIATLGSGLAAAGLVSLALAGPASAHVTVTPSTTAAGSYALLTFSVGHGCEGSPTTAIIISVPEGINAVTPTRHELYDVSKQTEKLDPPVTDAHGNELTERVATVTYAARTPLPDGFRDAFEVQLQIPEDAVGTDLVFPVVQECQQGETAWTEVAADGQSEDDLESPAPLFTVTEAGEDGHHDSGASEDAEADTSTDTATDTDTDTDTGDSGETGTEAVADDDEAGTGLAVAALITGIGGLLLGGAALARGRRTT